jgi:hypothetical protein
VRDRAPTHACLIAAMARDGTATGGQVAVHANTSCLEVIAAVQAHIAAWGACFRQDGWYPSQWARCCDGVNGMIIEVFVTDTRQRVLAACERDVH